MASYTSMTNITSPGSGFNYGSSSNRPFPHIKDIIALSSPKLSDNSSLKDCLAECETCIASANSGVNFGRPDVAFRNYLTATEIAIIIQKNKDFGFWVDNNKVWAGKWRNATMSLKKMSAQMEDIKHLIEQNNVQFRTVQQSNGIPKLNGSRNVPETKTPVSSSNGRPSVDLPDALAIGRSRPTSSPKPEQLRGQPIGGTDDLHSRLARLRVSSTALSMPNASDFQGQNGFSARPQGPRDMPPPPVPVKAPILMPKPPDPTYSPVSVSGAAEASRPPMERNQIYYNQPVNSAISPQVQRTRDDNPYRPKTPNGAYSAMIAKSQSSELPHNTMVDAETLAEYIRKYNVLLVDIRERTHFDEGHIFASSIICIEPVTLREGVSAEELEERLIISPDAEQALFSRRNEFDLVVYYDQSTDNDSYLKGPPTQNRTPHLRAFYDTLHEFNDYKRLKDGRPPALLRGGIDSWVEIMSVQSLVASRTAAMLGTTRHRGHSIGRNLGRMGSANSRYEIRNRRLRAHKFLDEKEQAIWREKAEQEQVATEPVQFSDVDYIEEEPEPTSPFVPDYESFLRKFPAVEQQSMVMAQPRKQPPPVPRYEPPPAIPSRPTPAMPRPSYHGQADIIQPQAPLARMSSSTKQPLYSSAMAARTRKIPKTGLVNFGVTCYMNSTLQCLSATIPLAQFFMDESVYRSNVQQNWKGSSGIMPDIFANVVRSLWKGDVQVIKPSTFRNFCGRMNREWVIDRQQDAKEFFDFLVDCLHEDLNINWQRSQLRPLTEAEEMQRERYPIPQAGPIEWNRYEHRDYSFISSLFAGQHASRLRCQTCHNTSTTYEAFYSISVEIPKTGAGDIYQCLRSYTQEEKLSELWRCPYCKCERHATKQIILTRLPQFLVIHFKRFSASKTEQARKIHTPIDFPLHGLMMDNFVVPGKSAINGTDLGDETRKNDPATTPPFTYDAYGVLRHLGNSGDSGHYISIIKDVGRNCWRKFDDQNHYDLNPAQLSPRERLQNSEAYIVFFQRASAK